MAVYLTGDKHGSFAQFKQSIDQFRKNGGNIYSNDTLVILGDAGFNYFLNDIDDYFKEQVNSLGFEVFCVHGNHEQRPELMKYETGEPMYHLVRFHGSYAYVQKEYPNLYFAVDGNVYYFNGHYCLVCGGAYSVDKYYRIRKGWQWFLNEQPSAETKELIEQKLIKMNHKVDTMLTHTMPYDFRPTEDFIKMTPAERWRVDNSTEEWFQKIWNENEIGKWYAGHFHCDKEKADGKIRILYNDIIRLGC